MYINYYHKYIWKWAFVTVLNFKSQTLVWAHKYSFTVKQRRDIRLNMYFLWNISRSNTQLPERFSQGLVWFGFAIASKHQSLRMTIWHIQPGTKWSHWNCSHATNETNLNYIQRSPLVANCFSKVLSHQRDSKDLYWFTQIQCRKPTVLVHPEKKNNLAYIFRALVVACC